MERKFTYSATYTPHHFEHAEGSIYIDKPGACTITLTGAASMAQAELNAYGRICARALQHSLRTRPDRR